MSGSGAFESSVAISWASPPSSSSKAFAFSSKLRLAKGEAAIGPTSEAGLTWVARKLSISAITSERGTEVSLWRRARSASSIWAAQPLAQLPEDPERFSGIGRSETAVVSEAARACA